MQVKTYSEFIAMVESMRNRQKSYFKTRSDIDLKKSKEEEADVDKAIKDYQESMKPQLF